MTQTSLKTNISSQRFPQFNQLASRVVDDIVERYADGLEHQGEGEPEGYINGGWFYRGVRNTEVNGMMAPFLLSQLELEIRKAIFYGRLPPGTSAVHIEHNLIQVSFPDVYEGFEDQRYRICSDIIYTEMTTDGKGRNTLRGTQTPPSSRLYRKLLNPNLD